MTLCAAVDCKNTGIHLFPKEAKRRKLWEKALRRKKWNASTSSRLCAAHFLPEDYYGPNSYTGDKSIHKVLKKTAVPSIFSYSKVKTVKQTTQQRSDSQLQRSLKKLCFETPCGDQIPGPSGIQTQNKCEVQFRDEQFTVQSEIEIPVGPQAELPTSKESSSSAESKSTQVNFEHIYGSIERYKDNDSVIAFYTGFETYAKFYFVFSTLSPMAHLIKYYGSHIQYISIEDQFFMTMMKLRRATKATRRVTRLLLSYRSLPLFGT